MRVRPSAELGLAIPTAHLPLPLSRARLRSRRPPLAPQPRSLQPALARHPRRPSRSIPAVTSIRTRSRSTNDAEMLVLPSVGLGPATLTAHLRPHPPHRLQLRHPPLPLAPRHPSRLILAATSIRTLCRSINDVEVLVPHYVMVDHVTPIALRPTLLPPPLPLRLPLQVRLRLPPLLSNLARTITRTLYRSTDNVLMDVRHTV